MRENLNKLICDSMENGCVGWCNHPPCYRVERVVDHLIANDVIIQKHGQWENIVNFGDCNCFGYCSNCKTEHRADNITALKMTYKHCRWCGAKMIE